MAYLLLVRRMPRSVRSYRENIATFSRAKIDIRDIRLRLVNVLT